RKGAVAEGKPVMVARDQVMVAALFDMLRADYKVNEQDCDRLALSLSGHIETKKPRKTSNDDPPRISLTAFFGAKRAVEVKTSDVDEYVAKRKDEGAANATINRELSALRRAYSLAMNAEVVHRSPRIRKLAENNV